ncbi:MAG: hypothetical protein P0111_00030 [Nitrospira sp.]|nr:hypothetical protein [Nitrospira sp.]
MWPTTHSAPIIGLVLSALFCLDGSPPVRAETLSILSAGNKMEGILVEAAMKRQLRTDGYTVTDETMEGYVLIVGVLPNVTLGGEKRGVIGNVVVSSVSAPVTEDSAGGDRCKRTHDQAQRVADVVGARILYINGTIAQAPNEESLAEILSTFAKREIRTMTGR